MQSKSILMVILLVLVSLAFLLVLVYTGFPGSPNYLGWKISGVWANQADTLQIMIHAQDSFLHGHVVSAQVNETNDKIVIGSMVVNDVKLKPIWNWSSGRYTDPYTKEEFVLRVKLNGSNKLKVLFLQRLNGVEEIVKKEEWNLINPM